MSAPAASDALAMRAVAPERYAIGGSAPRFSSTVATMRKIQASSSATKTWGAIERPCSVHSVHSVHSVGS